MSLSFGLGYRRRGSVSSSLRSKKRYPEIQPMNVPNTVRRLDSSRTYTLDVIVAISLLPREVATKTETAWVCRKLRPPQNSGRSGVSRTQNPKELRSPGCVKNSDPWLNWKLSQIHEKLRPSRYIEKSHPFILLNFRDFKALRSTVKMLLMAIEKFRMLLYTKWNEMFMNGTGCCKYFIPGLSFRDIRWSWIEWSLSCLRCKHCYFIDALPNNEIRSIFRFRWFVFPKNCLLSQDKRSTETMN